MRFYQFRRGLRRIRRQTTDAAKLAAIDAALADTEICTECCCAAEDQFENVAGGPFLEFFKFIIENQEAILKLVMTIVSLFSELKKETA